MGIGTSTPAVSLDVVGSIQNSDTYLFSDGSTQKQGSVQNNLSGNISTSLFA